ncbi:hypothetical protein [Ekhidna sp.]|uniref:hypothetical protein n=1 Tax=Ekhidna sp. TaxID=2608089 RepID=UPI0032EFA73C
MHRNFRCYIVCLLKAGGRPLVDVRKHNPNGKTNKQGDKDVPHDTVPDVENGEDDSKYLQDQPCYHQIGDGRLNDIPAIEFFEKFQVKWWLVLEIY